MLALSALFTVLPAQAQPFIDIFSPNGSIGSPWVVDRYNPKGFESVFFKGNSTFDDRLRLSISADDSQANRPVAFASSFYNTQGRQRDAAVSVTGSDLWTFSGELYVSEDLLTGAIQMSTDIWLRTGTAGDESTADYAIIGIVRDNPLDSTDTNPANFTSRIRIYDADTPNGWIDLYNVPTTGWIDLSITGNASGFEYSVDGIPLYTDSTVKDGANTTTAFIQARNYGRSYHVYWDNVSLQTAVPEPTVSMMLGLLGFIGLMRRHR